MSAICKLSRSLVNPHCAPVRSSSQRPPCLLAPHSVRRCIPPCYCPTPPGLLRFFTFLLTLCATALEARRDRMADCILSTGVRCVLHCFERGREKGGGGERRKSDVSLRNGMGGGDGVVLRGGT